MANAKEIQNRINSIQDTMKITRAMYMMSSMKLRKAKKKLEDTLPFFEGTQRAIAETMAHFPDMQHIFFDNRAKDQSEKKKRKGYVIMTGDKGMAGAYNHNAIKEAMSLVGNPKDDDYTLFVVGEVGRAFFINQGYHVDENFRYSANNPSMHRARVITEYLVELYKREEIDEIYIVYTKMLNSIAEETNVERLLPFKPHSSMQAEFEKKLAGVEKSEDDAHHITTLNSYEAEAMESGDDWVPFYPSPKRVLERLVYNFVTGFTYGALVECTASEENARMMAMQSATDNAETILRELSIEYNRVRQAAITQEITEVIGGAKALKKKKEKKKQQAR